MGNYLHTIFAIISYKVFLCLISSQSNPYLANASTIGSNPTAFLLSSTVKFGNSRWLILHETGNSEKIFRQFA